MAKKKLMDQIMMFQESDYTDGRGYSFPHLINATNAWLAQHPGIEVVEIKTFRQQDSERNPGDHTVLVHFRSSESIPARKVRVL